MGIVALVALLPGGLVSAADGTVAADHAGIAYLLESSKARIQRYDMAAERWLDPLATTGTPDAIAVDGSGIHWIDGSTVFRTTVAGEPPEVLFRADRTLLEVVVDPRFVFVVSGRIVWSIDKADSSLVDMRSFHQSIAGVSIAPASRRIFGWTTGSSTADQIQITYHADGRIGEQVDSPYHGDFNTSRKNWVIRNEALVATDLGIVFTGSDMKYAASLAGSLLDIADAGGDVVVLRDRRIHRYSERLLEVGRVPLAIDASHVFVHGNKTFALSVSNGTREVEILETASISAAPVVDPLPDPNGLVFTPDAVEAGDHGDLFLLSSGHRAIFRWSVAERRYVDIIGLAESPSHMARAPGRGRIFLAYPSGRLTVVSTDTGEESSFAAVPFAAQPMIPMGDLLYATAVSGFRAIFDRRGELVFHDDENAPLDLLWSPGRSRLFRLLRRNLRWATISPAGDVRDERSIFDSALMPPLRGNEDGSLMFIAPSFVASVDSPGEAQTLPVTAVDAAWRGTSLFTLRAGTSGSLLEEWDPSMSLRSSKRLAGDPLSLVAVPGDVAAITTEEGRPLVYMASDPEDFDRDGVDDSVDNCRDAANSDQRDLDADGRGDVCDPAPVDPDDDGILPDIDNCPFEANPGQADGDGDGVGDACDPYPGVVDNLETCLAEKAESQPLLAAAEALVVVEREGWEALRSGNEAMTSGVRWCPGDVDVDGTVAVDEILVAITAALEGCATTERAFADSREAVWQPRRALSGGSALDRCIRERDALWAAIDSARNELDALRSATAALRQDGERLREAGRCAADTDADAAVTIDEVIAVVVRALEGCGPAPASPTASPTRSATRVPTATPTATATASPTAVTPKPTPTLRPPGTPSRELPLAGVRLYRTGRYLQAVAVGDLDGDGWPDIATANHRSNDVSILFGAAGFDFHPAVTVAVGPAPLAIRLADLNADGVLDLLTANGPLGSEPSSLSILLGRGAGKFASEQRVALTGRPRNLEVADVDGDSVPDVIVGNPATNGRVSVFRGVGDGTLEDAVVREFSSRVGTDLAVGDVDRDGLQDLVSLDARSNAAVLVGDGRGGFTETSVPLEGASLGALALADLDGDSIPDLLHTAGDSYEPARLHQYRGNGDATFTHLGSVRVGDESRTVVAADFNGDGALDVAAANNLGDDVTVLLNDGRGRLREGDCIGAGPRPVDLAAADVDADGAVDLIVALGSGEVAVIPGRGDGTFASGERVPIGYNAVGAVAVDLDSDGRLDLAAVSLGDLVLRFQDVHGRFPRESLVATDVALEGLIGADLDGDGRTDLVGSSDRGLVILASRGDGSLVRHPPIASARDVSGIVVADLNGDGLADLATANEAASDVSVHLAIAPLRFADAVRFRVGDLPQALAAFDADGDGNIDLVVLNRLRDISVLTGDGVGGFTGERRIVLPEEAGFAMSMVATDLNRDSFPDLVVSTMNEDALVALVGDGSGNFATTDILLREGDRDHVALAAGDLNFDGHVDIVAANSYGGGLSYPPYPGDVSIYLGRGDGTFADARNLGVQPVSSPEHGVFGFGANSIGVLTADIDGDGALDVVTTNRGSGDLTILRSLGGVR